MCQHRLLILRSRDLSIPGELFKFFFLGGGGGGGEGGLLPPGNIANKQLYLSNRETSMSVRTNCVGD